MIVRRSLVVLIVTIAAWFSPIAASCQEHPNFGPLDAGGMPKCLIWLRLGSESAGHVLYSGRPYFVWVALAKSGQSFVKATWRRFGPYTFEKARHYVFNDGNLAENNDLDKQAELSPALASLHFANWSYDPAVWYMVNPFPPECGDAGPTPPLGHPHVVVGKDGKLRPDSGYRWVSNDPDDIEVIWSPGEPHPQQPNVVAAATEGRWTPAPGYRWVSDDDEDDMRVVSTGGGGVSAVYETRKIAGEWIQYDCSDNGNCNGTVITFRQDSSGTVTSIEGNITCEGGRATATFVGFNIRWVRTDTLAYSFRLTSRSVDRIHDGETEVTFKSDSAARSTGRDANGNTGWGEWRRR